MANKLETFLDLIKDIEIAMMTTRRPDGMLVSRPMATQAFAEGADLWFVTTKESPKLAEIAQSSDVNLSYYKDRTREWISVAGTARVVEDRAKIRELYRPDWRAWFEDKGGREDGGPDDPRIVLIGVDVRLAHYMEVNKPQAVVLFEVVKGMVTGKQPNLAEVQSVSGEEMHR
jgi:general stress protein 26